MPLVDATELAATYDPANYPSGEAALEAYQQYQDYRAANPETGRIAAGNALEMPPTRIRAWDNDRRPNSVRGIETARDYGWLDPDIRTLRGLTVLVAWVFSGGAIQRGQWVPYFTVEDEQDERRLGAAATAVGVEMDMTRSGGEQRARECRPVEDTSVLGRVLHCLGAPVGRKGAAEELRLPNWLDDAPEPVARDCVHTYLLNRGQWRDSGVITLREERSGQYLDALAQLFERVLGASVNRSEQNVIVSVAGREVVDSWSVPLMAE